MEITTTARKPFEKCAMDIVGPNTVTNKGNRYILTLQDDLTKFVVAEPIPTQDAETVAREFVRNIVLKFGIPEVVLSDQGSNILRQLSKTPANGSEQRELTLPRFTRNLTVGLREVTGFLSNTLDTMSLKTRGTGMTGYPTPPMFTM